MKKMKERVALFPSWLRDIMSKSVDKSESGLFDSDCRHFFLLHLLKSLVYDNGLVDRLHVSRLIIERSISLVFPV